MYQLIEIKGNVQLRFAIILDLIGEYMYAYRSLLYRRKQKQTQKKEVLIKPKFYRIGKAICLKINSMKLEN